MAQQDIAPTDNGADSLTKIEANFTELYSDKLDTADFDTQLASEINSATSKTTPVDADELGLVDSAASNVLKKLTWANLKATILAYFTTVTTTWSNKTLTSPVINAITGTDHITITPATSKLVKLAVLRQDNTTNAYKNNSVILTGWGWATGNGTNYQADKAVTFGITFSELPIVICQKLGYKDGSDPSDISDLTAYTIQTSSRPTSAIPHTMSVTGFTSRVGIFVAIPATQREGFSWIAIGQLN